MTQERLGVISQDTIFISRLGRYFSKAQVKREVTPKNGLQLNGKMILKLPAGSFTMV